MDTFSIRQSKFVTYLQLRSILSRLNKMQLRLETFRSVARQRRRLAEMSDIQLKDIGITRSEALKESSKWFWDIPEKLK